MFTPHPAGAFCAVVSMICGAALSPAQAEVLGGRLSLAHSAFVDDTSMAKSAAVGSIELPMGERFSMQSDLGLAGLHALDDKAVNITTHAILHFGADSAAGLFYGVDMMNGGSDDFLGLEYGRNLGAAQVEAYVAGIDSAEGSATLLGLAGEMPLSGGPFSLGAALDHASVGGGRSATRFGLTGGYAVGESTRLVAEIGTLGGGIGVDDTSGGYVKLGVDFTFGRNAGTTFGQRSVFNSIPGL